MTAASPTKPPGLRVSVIIPHLNTPELLARCLASVAAQRLDHGRAEIIVVDNGSTLPFDAVRADFPDVRFLVEPTPGPGPARNHGVAMASADILAFTDADCRADAGWLQAAVDAIEADPARAIVGGDIAIDFVDAARPTAIEAYEAVFSFDQRSYIETKNFSVTANLAMGRAVHAAVGAFGGIDTAEDSDWGTRAHRAGYRTRFLPQMRVFHPARNDYPALTRKFQRIIQHFWNDHVRSGAPRWRWQARAAAQLLAIPIGCLRALTSNRISGVSNRCNAMLVLARIRWFRAAEMLRVMAAPSDGSAPYWNRQA